MKKITEIVSKILLVVGGIAWGVYAFGKNIVNMIVGRWPAVEMIVYILVGVSAIIFAYKEWVKK